MKRSRKLISDNPRQVLRILLNRLNFPYTKDLYDVMSEHPNFPSFLSFHYLLKRIGINNAALHIGYNELMTMPMPAVIHVITNVELFLVVDKVEENGVYVIDEKGKHDFISRDEFLKMWEGNILIVDTDNILQSLSSKNHQKVKTFLSIIRKPFLVLSGVGLISYLLFIVGSRSWLSWIFLSVCGIGIGISILLLVAQFDKYNTFVKKLCTSKNDKSKRDCSSILDSKDAYFLGLFSWSDIGFVYFVALFFILLLLPEVGLFFTMLISLPAFGYVFYSVLYQKFVARSWCTLCLAVQGVLASLFILSISFFANLDIQQLLNITTIVAILIIGVSVIAAYVAIKPLIQARVEQHPLKQAHKLLKHEDYVTNATIGKQQSIAVDEFSPIRVGNPQASSCITIAFGPMCQPCMRELQILIPLLKTKTDTCFELFFIFDKKKSEEAESLARYLLKIYQNRPETFLDKLENYAITYPASRYRQPDIRESTDSTITEILSKHEAWRKTHKIHSTPVLYFNHKLLPSIYDTTDLDYMCS